jgi:DNA-binding transcriptional MerR regulator
VLNLKYRAERAPKYYTIAAAARALGVSPETLRNLERQGVVTPQRAEDTTRALRIYTPDDLQIVLVHYQRRGGPRVLSKR